MIDGLKSSLPVGVEVEELKALPSDQLVRLVKRLTLYAYYKMIRLVWRGVPARRGGTPAGGIEPDDLVNEAVVRVLDGTRQWNRIDHPTLEAFLESVLDSLISHLAESVENKRTRRETTDDEGDTAGIAEVRETDCEPSTLEIVVNKELAAKFRQEILREVGDDELIEQIMDCLQEDFTKASEIAEILGVPVEKIYKANAKFNKAAKRIRKKHGPM